MDERGVITSRLTHLGHLGEHELLVVVAVLAVRVHRVQKDLCDPRAQAAKMERRVRWRRACQQPLPQKKKRVIACSSRSIARGMHRRFGRRRRSRRTHAPHRSRAGWTPRAQTASRDARRGAARPGSGLPCYVSESVCVCARACVVGWKDPSLERAHARSIALCSPGTRRSHPRRAALQRWMAGWWVAVATTRATPATPPSSRSNRGWRAGVRRRRFPPARCCWRWRWRLASSSPPSSAAGNPKGFSSCAACRFGSPTGGRTDGRMDGWMEDATGRSAADRARDSAADPAD